ncbi:PAG2, partial [Cervus elaphus hippelaphus]
MFGGVDNAYYNGELNWVPVTKAWYWQITMDSGCQVLVDTRTSLLIGPSKVVPNIQKLIDAIASKDHEVKGQATGSLLVSLHTKDQQGQPPSLFLLQHVVSYKSIGALPPVIFMIDSTDYPVPPQVYMW